MAEAIVSAHINISADSATVEQATRKASASLRNFERQSKATGDAINGAFARMGATLAGALGLQQLVQFAFRINESVAALGVLSQQTGVSVERLDELRLMGARVGVGFEQMQQTMRGFAQRMQEGLANPSSAASLTLNALGVSARNADGSLRNFDQILPHLADAFSRYRDGATKAQLASALFGEEAGPKLLALLNRGSVGLEEVRRQIGATATKQDQERAEQYRETIARLTEEFERLGRELNTALVPLLRFLNWYIGNNAANFRDLGNAVSRTLGDANEDFRFQDAQINMLAERLERLHADLERTIELYSKGGLSIQHFTSAMSVLTDRILDHQRQWDSLNATRERFFEDENRRQARGALVLPGLRAAAPAAPEGPDLAKIREGIRQAQGQLDLFMANLQTLPMQMDFHSAAYVEAWRRMEAQMRLTGQTEGAIAAARINLLRQEEAERLRIMGGQLNAEETFARREHELRQARMQGIISEIELERALLAARMQSAAGALNAYGQIAGSLAQIFQKQKAWAYGAAVVQTAAAVTGALAQPPYWPWNAPQVAAAVAAGAAQIAAISRQTMSTSGGVAGSAPTAAAPDASQSGQLLTVNLHGSRFSQDDVAGFLEQIGEHISDGGSGHVIKVIRGT